MSAGSRSSRRASAGFTLVEIAIATVALGVVSALAAPRFIELGSQTRASRLDALSASIKAGSVLAHAASLATTPPQTGDAGSVVVDGSRVRTRFGYPDASIDGIVAAIGIDPVEHGSDVVVVAGGDSIRIELADAWSHARCGFAYTAATATSAPTLSEADTSGC